MDDAIYDQLLLDAYRRYGMSKLTREQLFAIIAHHDSKPTPTSRAICAAARQALVMASQRDGLWRNRGGGRMKDRPLGN